LIFVVLIKNKKLDVINQNSGITVFFREFLMKKGGFVLFMVFAFSFLFAQEYPKKLDEPKKLGETTRADIIQKDIEDAIKKLESNSLVESDDARMELIEIGRKAVPYLIKSLDNSKPEVRFVICEILGHIKDPSAVDTLIKHLTDNGEYGKSVASASAKALGMIGDEKSIPELVKILDTDQAKMDVELRYEIIVALGNLRAKDAEGNLKKFLDDKSETYIKQRIVFAVIEALGKIRANGSVKDIAKFLKDPTKEEESDRTIAMVAAKALQRITGTFYGPITIETDEKTKATIKKWIEWFDGERKKESQPKIDQTIQTMELIDNALEKFNLNEGRYPEKLIDLVQKPNYLKKPWPEGGYLKEIHKDGWGRDFEYQIIGPKGEKYQLLSYGEDGKSGGTGPDEDIRWETRDEFERKRKNTMVSMKIIVDAIEKFKATEGRYPDKLIDLSNKPLYAKLWKEPYLKEQQLKDGWGNDFGYKVLNIKDTPFELLSYGSDGKEGGIGRNADIQYQEEKK